MKSFTSLLLLFLTIVSCGEDVGIEKSTVNNTKMNNATLSNTTRSNNQTTNQCEECPTPTKSCDGEIAVSYLAGCEKGVCTLGTKQELDCTIDSKTCINGICMEITDLCLNVTCEAVETRCVGDILYESDGNTCNPKTGKCEETNITMTDCTLKNEECENATCVSKQKKRVFVTTGRYTGDLKKAGASQTGLQGADKLCEIEAQSAQLGGIWKAWLSDKTQDAVDRLNDVGPWYRINENTVLVESLATLVTRGPSDYIIREPDGSSAGIDKVWTATRANGRLTTGNDTCLNWTSERRADYGGVGSTDETEVKWTEDFTDSCNKKRHLYCFEQ